MHDYSGQRVIVTGGTRGIGRAIASAFLKAGAEVHALYAGNEEAANAFREANPERLHVEKVDVSNYGDVEGFFGRLSGPPQVVVNNAGIRRDQIVGMMPAEDWRRVLEVNLDGTFYVSKMAVMAMSRQRYGRIVNIVSPSAQLGFPGQASYAASKAGQIAMARSLAKEVAKRKITVNCVSPGFVDTELLADLTDEQKKAYVDMVPMKRFGTGEEVASAVLYLSSKDASYVSGATLEVTGGL